jgi:riboflavin biosynthesis pyrimidine reductase
MRRLLPAPAAEVTIEEAYDTPLGRRDDRPWCGLCMVQSVDGSTVVDGRSGALSSPEDSAILARLRRLADVIMVGAGTVRTEGYGPPRKPGQRIGVVTARGHVDLSTELFTSGAGFVITTTEAELDGGSVDVLRAGSGAVDLAEVVSRLPELCEGASFVQAEGGPHLNGALLAAGVLDELDLTFSPRIVGGDGPRLTTGAVPNDSRYALAQVLVDEDSFLYTRWVRRAD